MLSDSIRAMRREIQSALVEACGPITISGEMAQSFALSLVLFEEAALDMEEKLGVRPVLSNASGSVVIPLRPSNHTRPQLTVIHGDGGDVA
ncbi:MULTISPECIES: hypothetical protein [Brucella]|uniref:hypothetical protein n=1 Tax=Brucella TaxID=234 RepID=UPI000314A8CE|nr:MULTISPECIES: hypothetical protein [Brucella]KEY05821.1 hypothetical protein IL59_0201160 [Brucella suis bv. 4 str. 40]QGA56513.1 hypothetical protein GHC20_05170 [Brucella sp. 2280]